MAVNEVRRGNLVYQDTFFADTGRGNRHTRASVAELRRLLLPKTGRALVEDHVGHWYEAQLLHYGLSQTKDKNAAKVRLTSAIAAGTLTVPAYIVQLEADMKKEFTAAVRKAKAAAKKAQEARESRKSDAKGKKRRVEVDDGEQAPASSTKMSVRVGNIAFDIDHREESRTVRGTKKQKATRPSARVNLTRSSPSLNERLQPALPASILSSATHEPSAYSGYDQDNGHSEIDDGPPPPYESLDFDDTHAHRAYSAPANKLQASGTYAMSTSVAGMQCELTLVKDTTTGQFWARFAADEHEGVFNIPDATGIALQQAVALYWRAQDVATGQFRFRRDQDGWIRFDGRGGIKGCWNGFLYNGSLGFEGTLLGGPDIEVDELVDQWEWFIKCAYRR